MQRIPYYFNVLQILIKLLHVIDLLYGYLEFCQYLTILIVLILQLYFELLLLFQGPLQILNIFILLLCNMLVLDLQIKKSKQNICHLYIVFCYLLKHSSNSYMLIQLCF
jgi:hypothetical protein